MTVTESVKRCLNDTEEALRNGNRYALVGAAYWLAIWEREAREDFDEEKVLLTYLNSWNKIHGERESKDLSTAVLNVQFALSDIYYNTLMDRRNLE